MNRIWHRNLKPNDSVKELRLPTRIENSLLHAGFSTVRLTVEALDKGELSRCKGLGDYSIQFIRDITTGLKFEPCNHHWIVLASRVNEEPWSLKGRAVLGCPDCGETKEFRF